MAAYSSTGGYDCNFRSEPDDDLKCLICLLVARDPRQHEVCGKLFCSECIEKYGTDKPCPNCKKAGGQFYLDHKSKKNISELKVKCDNCKRGCLWKGTVGTLQKHVDTCKFALVPCPKECRDGNDKVRHFTRKDLDKHIEKNCPNRDYLCEYCREEGTYASIQEHDKTCEKKEVNCPIAGCDKIMQRQRVEKHVKTECEHAVISCKHISIGCEVRLKRKYMAAHEEDSFVHLNMALETIDFLREEWKNGQPLKFKVTNYEQKKYNNEQTHSPSYYTSPKGYRMALRVYANGDDDGKDTHVSVFVSILDGRYDAELKWPFVGEITFTLLNQLEDKNHYQKTTVLTAGVNAQVGDAWGRATFISQSKLDYDPVRNTQYLKDDTLYFRMEVEVADHKPWLE